MKITFTPLGWNHETQQVQFVATVFGKNGQDNFNYSGGILAFLPQKGSIKPYADSPGRVCDIWEQIAYQLKYTLRNADIPRLLQNVRNGRACVEKSTQPEVCAVRRLMVSLARPDEKGLIYALLSDAQAGDCDFASFCSEFGYDTDSRKAEATWHACRENAKKLARILSPDERAAAEKSVEDY